MRRHINLDLVNYNSLDGDKFTSANLARPSTNLILGLPLPRLPSTFPIRQTLSCSSSLITWPRNPSCLFLMFVNISQPCSSPLQHPLVRNKIHPWYSQHYSVETHFQRLNPLLHCLANIPCITNRIRMLTRSMPQQTFLSISLIYFGLLPNFGFY